MAKYDDTKKNLIRYTSRDFESIKADLINHAKRYYPETYKDFSEASFGSLMFDTVSYIGDILSFYLDYQVNESFIDTANEYSNIVKLARQAGYKFQGKPSSYGVVNFFVKVPATSTGLGPDSSYLGMIKRGSQVISSAGESYLLIEDVDFSHENNEMVVGQIDTSTGLPTHYVIKAKGQIVSGVVAQEFVKVDEFKSFRKIKIPDNNVAEILSVFDEEGHRYYEVDHLSQDTVYMEINNTDTATKDSTPKILKPVSVPRRFVVERDRLATHLIFGYGSEEDIKIDKVIDPTNIILNQYARDYVTDTSFDPTNLLGSDKFGVSPVNTTLRITYRTNSSSNPNAAVGAINQVGTIRLQFPDPSNLDAGTVAEIRASIECDNEEPVIGNVTLPSAYELKIRTKNHFPTQNRAVTKKDYKSLVYSMPPRFGAVKRCSITQDPDSFKRNLNIYVISEDSVGNLVETNSVIKQNIKKWLNDYRMVNDSIDIMDAKIVNLGITFTIVPESNANKYDILETCLVRLRTKMSRQFDIGEPFSFTTIYTELNKIEGVADAVNVSVFRKGGGEYSSLSFDLDSMITSDGRFIMCPVNCVYEIKYPTLDINGSVK
tara:strand:+ start:40479 stop:42287 length:1809 start_codon:yes stop_codon:yes gene_type:complete